MPTFTRKIPKNSSLHKKVVKMIHDRIKFAERGNTQRHDAWKKAEEETLAYLPESEADQERRTRREDHGEPKYTTIKIPYSYALLMSAHTYITSVFFGRDPVHQFAGRHGESEQQVQAMEAAVAYNVEVGGALGPYYVWIYDGLKYGAGIIGEFWDVETIHYGEIVEMPDEQGNNRLFQATREVEGYQGNRIYNISPYEFMHDPRVPLGRFQEGEFCVVERMLTWTQVLRRERQGYLMNREELDRHVVQAPQHGSGQLTRPETQTTLGDDTETDHPAAIHVYEFYVDLVPKEWGVGQTEFPQKWVFTITRDLSLLVGAQPLGYMHGKFPFEVWEPEVEAYGLFNRGIPEIIEPVQNTMDWLLNSHFFNVRAALNNQFVIDPSRVVVEDADDAGPGFRYRLRPEAYGQDIRQFFHQVPVNDVTQQHMQQDLPAMFDIGERTLGISEQIMGAIPEGGRRTATEVRTSTGFGVNRLKTISEYASATSMSEHSQRLVQNIQQYYDVEMKLRVVGDLAAAAGPDFLNVTPEMISGFYTFVPVDGTLPIDRMQQANLWKEMIMNIVSVPQIAQRYDLGKIFAWVAQLAGLKNINQFKVEVMGPGEQPRENVIPFSPGGGEQQIRGQARGNASSTQTGNNALAPEPEQ